MSMIQQSIASVCLWLAVGLIFFSDTAMAGSRLALVIGNDSYQSSPLASCVNDAKAIRQWLLSVGYSEDDILVKTNASSDEIIEAFEALAQTAGESRLEQVVIYYSGHGSSVPDDDDDEGPDDSRDEVFVGVDEEVVRDDQFFRFVNAVSKRVDQTVVILDCCFGAGMTKGFPSRSNGRKVKFFPPESIRGITEPSGSKAVGARKQPETVAGAIERTKPSERPTEQWLQPSSNGLVFLSSSNQLQTSAANGPGQKCSAFTTAFLETVDSLRGRVSQRGVVEGISLEGLRTQLEDTLRKEMQTPVLFPLNIDPGASFMPGMFPFPEQSEALGGVAFLIRGLLSLPESTRRTDWKLAAQPTRPVPVRIGSRFALKVTSNKTGYLVVFAIGASGNVYLLFPNRHARHSLIYEDETKIVPYADAFRADPPAGIDQYYVYLLDDKRFERLQYWAFEDGFSVGSIDEMVRKYPEIKSRLQVKAAGRTRDIAVRPRAETNHRPNTTAPEATWNASWNRAVVNVPIVE